MLYQATAVQVKEFTRKARRVERMLQRKNGSSVNPEFALAKVDEIIASTTAVELVPPEGCRIHTLRVPVIFGQSWPEAVEEAGPHTPDNYDVWKVGNQYPPTGEGVKEAEIVLLNYSRGGGSLDKAVAWATENRLKRTTPRHVFAIGKNKSRLHYELGINPMYVVATEECSFEGDQHACFVWWLVALRGASLGWVGNYGRSDGWFAFLRE